MKIVKQHGEIPQRQYTQGGLFVRRHHGYINLSAEVRDSILPNLFVRMEVVDGDLVLFPSNDPTEYRMSYSNKHTQGKLCIYHALNFVDIPSGKRLYGIKQNDGAIRISLSDGVEGAV